MPEDAWCRACGADRPGGPTVCGVCGVGLHRPAAGPGRVGLVVRTGGALLAKPGIAVDEDAGGVVVRIKGDEPARFAHEDFDRLERIEVAGPAILGAAGRLWKAVVARRTGGIKGKWAIESTEADAVRWACRDMGARRAGALDAMALGLGGHLSALGLSGDEIRWYRAWRCAGQGDTTGMVVELEALPPDRYAARVRLIASRAVDLLRDEALAERCRTMLRPFAGRLAEAHGLLIALDRQPDPDAVRLIEPIADDPRLADHARLVAVARALATRRSLPGGPVPGLSHMCALDAYQTGADGTQVDHLSEALAPLSLPLLERLIEVGALQRPPSRGAWPEKSLAYAHCRIDPGSATDAQLRLTGLVSERARRAYLAGDSGTLTLLPGGDPSVGHYTTLLRVRSTNRIGELDGLRPPEERLLRSIGALVSHAATGMVTDAAIADDPTLWPLLRGVAEEGLLELPSDTASRHPAFAAWLRLCTLRRLVYDGDWAGARTAGRRMARHAARPSDRAEALNLVAFAEWRSGDARAALASLGKAIAERPVPGLLINAALVAGDEVEAALPYLARLARETEEPALRRAAILRAVHIWQLGQDDAPFPAELIGMLRDAIQEKQPDTEQRTIFELLVVHDPSWFADARSIAVAGREQAAALRYYQLRAGLMSERHETSLEDVAAELARQARAANAPTWVTDELDWLGNLLEEFVHRDFGAAAHLESAISVLVKAGVLDKARRLVLSAQAGAHLVVYLQENENAFTREDRVRELLIGPAEEYLAGTAGLTPSEVECVGGELARCIVVSALAEGTLLDKTMDEFIDLWNTLNQRRQWDRANYGSLTARMRSEHAETTAMVNRLRPYLACLSRLPLDDPAREFFDNSTGVLRGWTAELDRVRAFL